MRRQPQLATGRLLRISGSIAGCLSPWQKEPSNYGRAVLTAGYPQMRSVR
jgi:hypothetical protein